jgi:GH24 family phage-related lysozyme (muramidase)
MNATVNSSIVEHLEAELDSEEGFRLTIYDDATGKAFLKGDTLKGNLSAGAGINLMIPFAVEEVRFIEQFRIAKGMSVLAGYEWFTAQDDVRKVVLGDLAYNIGPGGLMHWPHFLSYMAKKDYPAAVAEIRGNAIWISQVGHVRSQRLETMIETGQWPSDIVVPGVQAV